MTQQEALDILKLGHSVYLTGSAGSGKTYLLNQYIQYLRKHDVPHAVTASTGIAATHLGGQTIHSWSGLGIRDTLTEYDLEQLEERRYLFDRFRETQVLIIDEVSMLHHFRLDLVDRIIRSFRRTDLPFGGMQVILCGDFFQLPPISRAGEQPSRFVFESEAWEGTGFRICYLSEQHRQSDTEFISVLNAIRTNTVTEDEFEHLQSRFHKEPESAVPPAKLYTHNADVDRINQAELERLDGEARVYTMYTKGRGALVEALKKSCLAPSELRLKIGARVMFVKNNFEAGYVNGTLGEVVEFETDAPVIKTARGELIVAHPQSFRIEEEGHVKAEITQVPLRLAWAITVHKSQGMSLDAVEVDLSKSFEPGMGYVALSRVRSLSGLKLIGLNDVSLRVRDDVLLFDEKLRSMSEASGELLAKLSETEKKKLQQEYLTAIRPTKKTKVPKESTYEKTKALVKKKMGLSDIARERDMTIDTVLSHLEKLVDDGLINPEKECAHLKPKPAQFLKMKDAFLEIFEETGDMRLTPVRERLSNTVNFEELRLARLFLEK